MPALVVSVRDIFRAIGRECTRQNPVQGIVGVVCDRSGRSNAFNLVASAVVVIDRCPGVRVALLNQVAESIIDVGGRNSGGGGNG